jgi:hypothetical protein
VEIKLEKFLQLIGTINPSNAELNSICRLLALGAHHILHVGRIRVKRTIFRKVRTETILKIYNTLVIPTFLYGSENLTLTALQRRRTEAAEMKLLRPLAGYTLHDHKTNAVNYRLNTYRQNRWKQTELAFTPAKNATKPNPFEIISLQTTRKENNWKTEETLARAFVTLETERIKGSNP